MDQFTIPNIPVAPDVDTLRLSVTNALSKLVGQLNAQSTQLDAGGQRVLNVATPTSPNDAVNLRYLKYNVGTTSISGGSGGGSGLDAYTIVFSADYAYTGDAFPAFIVGDDRGGFAEEAWVYADGTPVSTGGLAINISRNGTNMLSTDLVLATGSNGPVFSSSFSTTAVTHGDVIQLQTIDMGGVTGVSVGLVIKRA